LAADVRLAGSLEADERDHRRVTREAERLISGREERHQLVVDDLDDLLAGGEARQDLGPDRLLANTRDEILDHAKLDVRLEQREPDLAHGDVDVGLGHVPTSGEGGERAAQAIAELIEHEGSGPLSHGPGKIGDGSASARRARGFWRAGWGSVAARVRS